MSSSSFKHVGERIPRTPIKVNGLDTNDDYQAIRDYKQTHPEYTASHKRTMTLTERTMALGIVTVGVLTKLNRK